MMRFSGSVVLINFVHCCPVRQHSSHSERTGSTVVMADGRITVNGAPATMESLRESLKTLAEQKGVVRYYREAANTEPSPVVKQVVQAIVDARLPVRLSNRADYSDTIGPDGSQ